MTPEPLFLIAGRVAISGWLLLAAGLLLPRRWSAPLLFLGGRAIPVLLSAAYPASMWRWWGQSAGGFETLDALAQLFDTPGLLLAGWIHYLAFDLLVGRWQVDQTLAADVPVLVRALVLPCLAATLMFGPVGLLLFLLLSMAARKWTRPVVLAA